ncbi:MAG: hypothetical protein PHO01_02475 [Desulfotomaculaceae bacterium]|nr:hypothetical protein [Desulfotomaculaceae bacterium]
MRPRRVRSSFARAQAQKYLRESGLSGPPVNVIELIERHGQVIWHKDAGNGFTVYHEKQGAYRVFIDPDTIRGHGKPEDDPPEVRSCLSPENPVCSGTLPTVYLQNGSHSLCYLLPYIPLYPGYP